jgi:arylsulfatase A-like enzyme/predicted Zn-dependent protease
MALAVAVAASGCTDPGPPDLLVVTIDTLRADRLGAYGNPDGLTPNLDALASRSVVFEDATAPVPITLPSHASFFTGRYPTATGVRNNGTFQVPEVERTLAEILLDAGWSTGAVVAAYPLHARYGLGQGFTVYDDHFPTLAESSSSDVPVFFPERDAKQVTDRAMEVWRGLGDGRRFLWVHYFDPHAPYAAPEPYGLRYTDRPYDGEVAYVDAQIGRLLRAIDDDRGGTVVLVASDHGEGLGEHDEKTHGVFLYQSTLHVPLLLRAPGRLPASRVTEPVSLVDVLPTLLAVLDVPGGPESDGADLVPLVVDGVAPGRPVYGESFLARYEYRFGELRAIRSGALKYIDAPDPELYDLREDPEESLDLAREHPEARVLAERLQTFLALEDPAASERAESVLDDVAIANLRALGYLAGTDEDETGAARDRGRDPKTMTAYMRSYDRALGLVSAGRYDDGIAKLEQLAPLAPENDRIDFQIANALLAAGRPAEAEARLSAVVEAAPPSTNTLLLLARTQAAQGKIEETRRTYLAAVNSAPWAARPRYRLGLFLEEQGFFNEAAAEYLAAADLEPTDVAIADALLGLRHSRGDLPRAERDFSALAERHPDAVGVLIAWGRALTLQGRAAEAEPILRRALVSNPASGDAALTLGKVLLDLNRPGEALDFYRALPASAGPSPALHLAKAQALVRLGSPADAEEELTAALALDPRYAPAYTLRGQILEEDGDRAGAIAMYRRALSLNRRDRVAYEGLQRLGNRP